MGSRKVRNLEKHVRASIELRVMGTNADHFMVPETCDMPPEAEALSHMRHAFATAQVFLQGMDIGIVVKTRHTHPGL